MNPIADNLSQFISVAEFSRLTSLGEERVRQLIRQKEIRAIRIKKWLIPKEEVQRFINSRWNVSN